MTDAPSKSDGNASAHFPDTRWSLVVATAGDDDKGRAALAELCRLYWRPLFAFVRWQGFGKEDAEDITQDFFQRVVAKDGFGEADRGRGRLRTFLLACLTNHIRNHRKRAGRQKRGGGAEIISIDADLETDRQRDGLATTDTPETLFEREWAIQVLELAMLQLRTRYATSGKEPLFEALVPFLSWNENDVTYRDTGDLLGMSESAVKVAVHRLRRRYRKALHAVVADTLPSASEGEVQRELLYLFRALG